MALTRSRSTDFFPHKTMSTNTRQLQEALYTHLDDLEKSAFIEALSAYGAHRDIFELVNALKKILNTPVKRQLFPLVRKVIRQGDVEAFDLLTRGDKQQHNTLPRPFLYRPHTADLNVLNKYRSATASGAHRSISKSENVTPASQRRRHTKPPITLHRSRTRQNEGGVEHIVGEANSRDQHHKTLSRRSSNSRHDLEGEIFEIDIGEPDSEDEGFGFNIRGGQEHGVGVYISSVDNGSSAQKRGLTTGDLILEANNISFRDITHDEAARIIRAATRLHLTVSRVGRVPGTHTVLETYRWTDPKGRPVSPPIEIGDDESVDDDGRKRSGTLMLKGSDERKVNIVVQRGHGLGLMIRGGKEYGLGIYISGIDPFSVAENAGLKLGDQILDVNGRSFLDITHSQAVTQLKKGRHLIITVKDVGKIPFAKTTIDETGWIESTKVDSYVRSVSSRSVSGSVSDPDWDKKTFTRGAGTQLMLSSVRATNSQKELIHDQARHLLNESEHATLNYYLAEYEKRAINVQGLVHALFELLNTPAKFTLLSEIRTAIQAKDLDTFDQLVVNRDLEKSLNEARGMLAPDVISIGSYDSNDVTRNDKHRRTMFAHTEYFHRMFQKSVLQKPQWMDTIQFDEEPDIPPINYGSLSASKRLSRSTPDLSKFEMNRRSHVKTRPRSSSKSRSPNSAYELMTSNENSARNMALNSQVVRAEVHTPKGKVDDPSDDSGVEINGHNVNGATGVAMMSEVRQTEYTSRYKPVKPRHFQGSYSKSLSGPQQKILTHLHHSEDKSNETAKSSNSYPNVKHKTLSLPRSLKTFRNAPSGGRLNSHNVTAEVHSHHHHTPGSDDISDNVADPLTSQYNTPGHSGQSMSSRHSRSRHRSTPGDRSRSRSRSKSQSRIVTSTNAYDFNGSQPYNNTDLPLQNQKFSNVQSEPNIYEQDIFFPRIPRYDDMDRKGGGARQRTENNTIHEQVSHRANSPRQTHSGLKRGKSPLIREGRKSMSNHNNETSSSSTAVNSSRSHSTLTINGQPMSAALPPHLRNHMTIQDTLTEPRNATSSTSKQIQQQNQKPHGYHHQDQPQQQPQKQPQQQPQERKTRSRSRSPKPPRSSKVSRSKSPQPAPKQRPHVDSLFFSDTNPQSPASTTHMESQLISGEKTRLFTSPIKDSNPTSPRRRSGSHASKYFSPTHSKQGPSKPSVPMIRIERDGDSITDESPSRYDKTTQPGTSCSVPQKQIYLTVEQNTDVYAVPTKALESVTISDEPVDIDTALRNNSHGGQTNSNGGNNNNNNRGLNVTSISVGGASSDNRAFSKMDGCLGHTGFRLPRPEVFTPVELAIMDDRKKIEAVKKKAGEKYGEIPLDVIYIYRSKPTLGVAIEGGANTRQPLPKVINVQPGGSAFESGGLKVGHVILEVNGQPAVGLSHMDAARLIAEAFKSKTNDRMELLVTEWSDRLLDTIKVDVGLLKV